MGGVFVPGAGFGLVDVSELFWDTALFDVVVDRPAEDAVSAAIFRMRSICA